MVLNRFRHILPKFIDGPVNFCIKHHITPNMISLIGFIFSTAAAITIALPDVFFRNYTKITDDFWWWWACVPGWLFFIGAYIDALDGSVARKTNQVTRFGGFFDSTLDRLSDAVFLMGLMYSGMIWPWDRRINALLTFTAISVVLLISYTRSRAELEGVTMKGIGFMERAERVFILIGGMVIEWAIYAIQTQYFGGQITHWFFPTFFIIFILLCLQTLYRRIRWTYLWLTGKMSEDEKRAYIEMINGERKAKSE